MHSLHKVSSREVGGLGHSIRRGAGVNKVHSGFLIRYRHSRLCHKKIDPWKMRKDQNCYYPKKVQKVWKLQQASRRASVNWSRGEEWQKNRLEAKSICFCVVETWQTVQSHWGATVPKNHNRETGSPSIGEWHIQRLFVMARITMIAISIKITITESAIIVSFGLRRGENCNGHSGRNFLSSSLVAVEGGRGDEGPTFPPVKLLFYQKPSREDERNGGSTFPPVRNSGEFRFYFLPPENLTACQAAGSSGGKMNTPNVFLVTTVANTNY